MINNDAVTAINVQNFHIQVQEEKLPYIIPNQVLSPFLSQINLLILFYHLSSASPHPPSYRYWHFMFLFLLLYFLLITPFFRVLSFIF